MDQSQPSRTRKPPTPGSWKPGASGNPKGRPRRGDALAEAIRSKCDPEELASIAMTIAREGASEGVRIQAMQFLADRGYVRPEQRHELVVGTMEDEPDLSHLTVDQLRQLTELEDQRAAILATEPLNVIAMPTSDERPNEGATS